MYFGFSNSIVARFENKRKVGCKISQVFKLLITSSGHFSEREQKIKYCSFLFGLILMSY